MICLTLILKEVTMAPSLNWDYSCSSWTSWRVARSLQLIRLIEYFTNFTIANFLFQVLLLQLAVRQASKIKINYWYCFDENIKKLIPFLVLLLLKLLPRSMIWLPSLEINSQVGCCCYGQNVRLQNRSETATLISCNQLTVRLRLRNILHFLIYLVIFYLKYQQQQFVIASSCWIVLFIVWPVWKNYPAWSRRISIVHPCSSQRNHQSWK